MNRAKKFSVGTLVMLFFCFGFILKAQADCGEIVTPAGFYSPEDLEERLLIENCANPFGETEFNNYSVIPSFGDIPIVEGDDLIVDTLPVTLSYDEKWSGISSTTQLYTAIYQQVDSNYYLIPSLAEEVTFHATGTYVLVINAYELFLTENTKWWHNSFTDLFMPSVAYAEEPSFNDVFVIPFTVSLSPPQSTGASSILFLPGIMGSRLYEESDVCGNETAIQERWFSRDSCSQLRLKATFLGKSINEIFTDTKQSSIVDEALGFNSYKSFLEHLTDLKTEGTIKDYVALPYDWRLMLQDVVKSSEINGRVVAASTENIQDGLLYKTIEKLAADSLSGKVSIVTHSNGGLLSKYFIDTLEKQNDPLLSKIDNLFLVAVPQAGTPESVISILHGTELGMGLVLNQQTARELVNSMPVVHHLLPSDKYFESDLAVDFPVIKFLGGDLTNQWLSSFGDEVTTADSLYDFLSKESGRTKPASDDLLQPEVTDRSLLDYAEITHVLQSAWQPPENMTVYQLAGTGVFTPVEITYFTDLECVSRSITSAFTCKEYAPKLGYRITKVDAGDGTVVFPSAMAMKESNQVKQMIVDLFEYNDSHFNNKIHRNILEIEEVQDYIDDILTESEGFDYDYLSETPTPSQSEQRIVFQLHSPLDMKLVASNGQELSSSTKDIKNGTYERFGEVQYISVPRSTDDFELVLTGLAEGSFTLDVEKWQGNVMKQQIDFVAVPSTFGTKVVMSVTKSSVLPQTFTVDYDSNGEIDVIVNEDGSVESFLVLPETPIVQSNSRSSGTRIIREKPVGQVAGITTSISEEDKYLQELAVLLTELSRLLNLLYKI